LILLIMDVPRFLTETIEPFSGVIKLHRSVFRDLNHLTEV
jgi:hypothetical protein